MQAYVQSLCQTRWRREKCAVFVPAFSAAEQQLFLRHLPRSRHSVSSHCQPWHSSPLTSISHFIMSHHNSRRLAGSALLGVSWRCSQVSQVSQVSQCWQPPHAVIHSYQQAQVAKPWGRQSHPITIHQIKFQHRTIKAKKSEKEKNFGINKKLIELKIKWSNYIAWGNLYGYLSSD